MYVLLLVILFVVGFLFGFFFSEPKHEEKTFVTQIASGIIFGLMITCFTTIIGIVLMIFLQLSKWWWRKLFEIKDHT